MAAIVRNAAAPGGMAPSIAKNATAFFAPSAPRDRGVVVQRRALVLDTDAARHCAGCGHRCRCEQRDQQDRLHASVRFWFGIGILLY
jgi:hypothetical protein